MEIDEVMLAKDLRIKVLEAQLTACKSDRARLKKQSKEYNNIQKRQLLVAYESYCNKQLGIHTQDKDEIMIKEFLSSLNKN